MPTALTIAVTLVLIALATYVIHRLNAQHADRIAVHHYSRFQPGRPGTPDGAAQPVPGRPGPPAVPARRDQRYGGRGRLRPRRRIRQEHGR
ncbi:hypothetical protein ACIQ9Q_05480 [Streptomyces sp. NPDC094438]|uniref:hypothetical protein n=1 Tax=Streptomyces sp. NPDC094438 TaxID=3366061 RepID=UPI0038134404